MISRIAIMWLLLARGAQPTGIPLVAPLSAADQPYLPEDDTEFIVRHFQRVISVSLATNRIVAHKKFAAEDTHLVGAWLAGARCARRRMVLPVRTASAADSDANEAAPPHQLDGMGHASVGARA